MLVSEISRYLLKYNTLIGLCDRYDFPSRLNCFEIRLIISFRDRFLHLERLQKLKEIKLFPRRAFQKRAGKSVLVKRYPLCRIGFMLLGFFYFVIAYIPMHNLTEIICSFQFLLTFQWLVPLNNLLSMW